MAAADLNEFEIRLLKWLAASDFEEVPWSTKRAADAFKVNENEVYEALSALTVKVHIISTFTTKMLLFASLLMMISDLKMTLKDNGAQSNDSEDSVPTGSRMSRISRHRGRGRFDVSSINPRRTISDI